MSAETIPHPVHALAAMLHTFPHFPAGVDATLRDKGSKAVGDWPAWCFLPTEHWLTIGYQDRPLPRTIGTHFATDADRREALDVIYDIEVLSMVGTWRYTQGIYRYDPDVMAALLHTDLTGDLPAEMLLRLPEWSVYIEADLTFWGQPVAGFFARLDYDRGNGSHELHIMAVSPDGDVMAMDAHGTAIVSPLVVVKLGAGSLADSIAASFYHPNGRVDEGHVRDAAAAWAREMTPYISLLLYLCTDEPEIDDSRVPGVSPTRPRMKRTKRGWRLFAPDRARVWDVGTQTGEVIRRGRRAVNETGQRTVRPHIRRGHWHGYWYGPRTGDQIFRCRWLPPMTVASGEDAS